MRRGLVALATAGALGMTSWSGAQPPEGETPLKPPCQCEAPADSAGAVRRLRGPLLAFFDLDRDGTLSASEIEKATSILAQLDERDDGEKGTGKAGPRRGPREGNFDAGPPPGRPRFAGPPGRREDERYRGRRGDDGDRHEPPPHFRHEFHARFAQHQDRPVPPERPGAERGDFARRRPPHPPHPPQLGDVLPPFVRDRLELTEEQQEALTKLQEETKEKLTSILTEEQQETFDEIVSRGPPMPPPPPERWRGRPGRGHRPDREDHPEQD